jgi:hypothetical protein
MNSVASGGKDEVLKRRRPVVRVDHVTRLWNVKTKFPHFQRYERRAKHLGRVLRLLNLQLQRWRCNILLECSSKVEESVFCLKTHRAILGYLLQK